ncbi:MAG: DUF4276 family protein [bacterium]
MPLRLHITAEGQTEERFVKAVLAPYLGEKMVLADARCVLTSKNKRAGIEYRGGFRRSAPYQTVKKDICAWMKEDHGPDVRFTTMFDLYALPSDFPEYSEAQRETSPYRRVEVLERALAADINGELNDSRFIPYIQLHEFETLILADPRQLDYEFLEHDAPIQSLVDMVAREGGNPELIDDGQNTSPSKRIIAEIAEYGGNKATSGPLVAGKIGMPRLRRCCQHFSEWVDRLVMLVGQSV